ncbi:MAG: hypothetical protein K6E10_01380 [Eubacterium sp.]|nr:hypothetical protein [Eubacterium sp.]
MFMQVRNRGTGLQHDQLVIINTDAIYLITGLPGMNPVRLYEIWLGDAQRDNGKVIVDQEDAFRIFNVIGVGL